MNNDLVRKFVNIFGLTRTLVISDDCINILDTFLSLGSNAYGIDNKIENKSHRVKYIDNFFSCQLLPYPDDYFDSVLFILDVKEINEGNLLSLFHELHRVCSSNILFVLRNPSKTISFSERLIMHSDIADIEKFIVHPHFFEFVNMNDILLPKSEIIIPLLSQKKIKNKTITNENCSFIYLKNLYEVNNFFLAASTSKYIKNNDDVLFLANNTNALSLIFKKLYPQTIFNFNQFKNINFNFLSNLVDKSCFFHNIFLYIEKDDKEPPFIFFELLSKLLLPGGRIIILIADNGHTFISSKDFMIGLFKKSEWKTLNAVNNEYYFENIIYNSSNNSNVSVLNYFPNSYIETITTNDKNVLDDISVSFMISFMKCPINNNYHYQETFFKNLNNSSSPVCDYSNFYRYPFLLHAIVNVEFRIQNENSLEKICLRLLKSENNYSNDYFAALCVYSYLCLKKSHKYKNKALIFHKKIKSFRIKNGVNYRWKISLLFVQGLLYQSLGKSNLALSSYLKIYDLHSKAYIFSIHIYTKVMDAVYKSGLIYLSQNDNKRALKIWKKGIHLGRKLLDVDVNDILINSDEPNLFDHGDGVREYTLSWDIIAKCANGINLINNNNSQNYLKLNSSFTTQLDESRHNIATLDNIIKNLLRIVNESK